MPAEYADLIIHSATVHTLDPDSAGTAVAVRNGLVTAVGCDADILALAGPATEVVDGSSLTLTPGLTDSHQHPLMGLEHGRGLDLTGVDRLEELRDRLRAYSANLGPEEWVIARGVEFNAFAGRSLHHEVLDDVTGGRPAFLWMIDVHTALMNRRGLEQAGITGARQFEDASEIVVDAAGRPTGELHEGNAVFAGYAAVPPLDAAQQHAQLRGHFAALNAAGITEIHILDNWRGTEQALRALEADGELTVRVLWAPWCLPGTTDQLLEQIGATRAAGQGRYWKVAAVKFLIDGAVDGGGAWLCTADYLGGNDRSIWRDVEAYRGSVRRMAGAGLPAWTHAIGDEGVSAVLDTYAGLARPEGGARFRIEHVEVLKDQDVDRFAGQDVVASMQPTHMDWTRADHQDNWSRRVGEHHWDKAWRCADIAAAGGRVAIGSDWPVVDFDPRGILASAQLRRPVHDAAREPHLPLQALTARQALEGYTVQAAYGAGQEAVAGRIAPGFRADLVLWRRDILACPPEELPQVDVVLTIMDGQVVHGAVPAMARP
ncbi:amidohydrolase [Arthrobacter mobilis]|uniref:Amidohydrolase n=1 Tax=Arthrobacter mobilis TaxID=2724944 RepID=A0A7X6HG62_9MICC|nr:amidohydrolase [Arthrobacter mobilis]NKX55604.1 amidohydrolase [Arthrobacter mobilis]